MNKRIILIISLIAMTALISGCIATVIAADDSLATPEGIEATVDASNHFAFDLYEKYSEKEGNIFFSPYSISSA